MSAVPSRILVIGGGPAGMMAAGTAAEAGAGVTLVERMDRPGRKLRITGKGRCNLTNADLMETFPKRFRSGGRFLRSAFHRFSDQDLVAFMADLGVTTVVERGQRVFPESGDAREVVQALRSWILRLGVRIETGLRVSGITVRQGRACGLEAIGADGRPQSRAGAAVVLAAGGSSYPATGSSGDGFQLAESLGHRIVPVHPGLVPLETSGDRAARLQGLSLRNVGLQVRIEGKKRFEEFGELVFTHFGLSGPAVLTVSSKIVQALRQGQSVTACLDLKPALDETKLDRRLQRDLAERGGQKLQNLLRGLLPAKLVPVCLEDVGLSAETLGSQVTAEERKRLRLWLKDCRFEVVGSRSWPEAIVTVGGVELSQVDPRTLRSKLVQGLFLAGEVLNVDADTGGFNLQAAFSTGRLAGLSAAAEVLSKPEASAGEPLG